MSSTGKMPLPPRLPEFHTAQDVPLQDEKVFEEVYEENVEEPPPRFLPPRGGALNPSPCLRSLRRFTLFRRPVSMI